MKDPYLYCLFLLKRRMRSRHELDEAMRRKEVGEEDRGTVLTLLEEQGYIDDLAFGRAWVHTRDALAPRGAPVLRQELLLRGIGKDVISTVLGERKEAAEDEESDQKNDIELATRLANGKARLYSNLSPEVKKRRLGAFLQRRGFSYNVIRRILEA